MNQLIVNLKWLEDQDKHPIGAFSVFLLCLLQVLLKQQVGMSLDTKPLHSCPENLFPTKHKGISATFST